MVVVLSILVFFIQFGLLLHTVIFSLNREIAWQTFWSVIIFLLIAYVETMGKIFSRWVCSSLSVKLVGVRSVRPTQRVPDARQSTSGPHLHHTPFGAVQVWWWESARFQVVCVAWS